MDHSIETISNIGKDKSFVDDLNKKQGIVSMRVGFVLRSTEIKPLFQRFVLLWTTLLLLWEYTTGVVYIRPPVALLGHNTTHPVLISTASNHKGLVACLLSLPSYLLLALPTLLLRPA